MNCVVYHGMDRLTSSEKERLERRYGKPVLHKDEYEELKVAARNIMTRPTPKPEESTLALAKAIEGLSRETRIGLQEIADSLLRLSGTSTED